MPISTPAIPANTPPKIMESSRRTISFSRENAPTNHAEAITPLNAPTLIKPAWPRLSSPDTPTTRFSDTAITMYTQIGTSCPLSERLMPPLAASTWQATKAAMTRP